MSLDESKTTDNHITIKKWAEERDGKPALMDGIVPENGGGEMLRINFMGGSEGPMNQISWDKFFEIFENNNLLFLYEDEIKVGEKSKFHKFIKKDKE